MQFKYICSSGDASSSYEVTDCFPITVEGFMNHIFSERDKYSLRLIFEVSNNVYDEHENYIEFERSGWAYRGEWFVKRKSPFDFQDAFKEKTVIKAIYNGGYGHDLYILYLEDEEK